MAKETKDTKNLTNTNNTQATKSNSAKKNSNTKQAKSNKKIKINAKKVYKLNSKNIDFDKLKKLNSKKRKSVNRTKDTSKKSKISKVEYYDLPYRYNQTVVRVLAQTPNNLFIYWDISDEDRENYKKIYGENFFETTKPILIVHNDTMNYSFEVEINDFANSWYLHINDSKCDYRIELGRKVIYNGVNNSDISEELKNKNYVYITSSNEIESPNDRILFNPKQNMVYYRNVKTMQIKSKEISNITFIHSIGKIYHSNISNIHNFYKKMFNIDLSQSLQLPTNNPSSGLTVSGKCNF